MGERRSSRIAAAKARLKTGNAKATRSSDRIAKMTKLRQNDQQSIPDPRMPQGHRKITDGRPKKQRPAQTRERASNRQPDGRHSPADAIADGAGRATSRSSGSHGDISSGVTGGNRRIPEAQNGSRTNLPDTSATGRVSRSEEANDPVDEPGLDINGRDDDLHTPEDSELQLFQILLSGVTAQRALHRMQAELKTCENEIQDAQLMVTTNRRAIDFRNPETEADWNAHRVFRRLVAQWEPRLEEQKNLEIRLGDQIRFMKNRIKMHVGSLQSIPFPDRDSQHLRSLSASDEFWDCMKDLRAEHQSCEDIDHALRQADEAQNTLNNAIDVSCRHHLHLVLHEVGSIAAVRELDAYQDVSRIAGIEQDRDELRERQREVRMSQMEVALRLLDIAEAAFVRTSILQVVEEKAEKEADEAEEHLSLDGPERELPRTPSPDDIKSEVRENLRVALEACHKARDEFEDARIFSQREIDQLPQPADPDNIGAARVEKLMRLTHALHEAEDEYRDARRRARDAGLANPQEQSADFSDCSSDGYGGSLLRRAVDQSHERISRMERWTGLHVENLESASSRMEVDSDYAIEEVRSVRVGEDSFDCTEAVGRTRKHIDAMRAESERIRGHGEFPTAERDSLTVG